MQKENILLLAPHPDDIEFACGGAVAKWAEEGKALHYIAFSPCIASIPAGMDQNVLAQELTKATKVLGIPTSNVRLLEFPVRHFPEHRQQILEYLVELRTELKPDLVIMPCSTDVHQDHRQIHLEGIRAFKNCSMLGYEQPWNNLSVTTNFHVGIDRRHLERKYEAVQCYVSQKSRPYSDLDFIKGWARVRGVQVQTPYAEAFELIRWIEK